MHTDCEGSLGVADQAFIDAVFAHNGRPPPREQVARIATGDGSLPPVSLSLLNAVLGHLNADCGYDHWLRIGAAIFHETGGTDEGLDVFDRWSATGDKYKGKRDTANKWRSFRPDHPSPVTMATLRRMVELEGVAWTDLLDATEDQFQAVDGAGEEI